MNRDSLGAYGAGRFRFDSTAPRDHISHAPESLSAGARAGGFLRWRLADQKGRIAACGDYGAVRGACSRARTRDLRGGFLLPGFIDVHVHYPQIRILGALGYSLLDWLEKWTLPEEARFASPDYAATVASEFVHALLSNGTTTALVFGSHFSPATSLLFEAARRAGLRIASGLVLSDRFLRPELHVDAETAYSESRELIRRFHGRGNALYAVSPGFALSTSEALLEVCQTLVAEHPGVLLQSHLNESAREIEEIGRLFPWARDYLAVYERFDLTGEHTVLAHSVHSSPSEVEREAGWLIVLQAMRRWVAASFRCGGMWKPGRVSRWERMWPAGRVLECLRKFSRHISAKGCWAVMAGISRRHTFCIWPRARGGSSGAGGGDWRLSAREIGRFHLPYTA